VAVRSLALGHVVPVKGGGAQRWVSMTRLLSARGFCRANLVKKIVGQFSTLAGLSKDCVVSLASPVSCLLSRPPAPVADERNTLFCLGASAL